jgi:ubiquinone/menaquinone biosynthesis C-methylase UbiE
VPTPLLTALATAVLRVPERPERILAIECGEGDDVLFLAREFPAARVRGVDRSADAIRRATGRVGLDPEGRVAFKHAPGHALPYPDDFFDLVVHLGGPLRAGEAARVLSPGGSLLLLGSRRLLDWRLRGCGFEALQAGEAAGTPFHLARFCV